MMLGGVASRRGQCRLTCAGEREAQAPSTRTRRAWVLPALVIVPCRRCSPEEYSEGTRPKNFGCVPPFTRGVLGHESGRVLNRALRPLVQAYL